MSVAVVESVVVAVARVGLSLVSYCASMVPYRLAFMRAGEGAAQTIPLTPDPEVLQSFSVRNDYGDGQRVVNVYDQHGELRYTFERPHHFASVWRLLRARGRTEIARLHVGLRDRSVDFHTKPGLQHRALVPGPSAIAGLPGVPGVRSRRFFLNDGNIYEWNRATKFLERVINPGGGREEIRMRVAHARLMRPFRFDYELLVDPTQIDPEVALATGFLGMAAQWGLGGVGPTVGPTFVVSKPQEGAHLPAPRVPKSLAARSRPQDPHEQKVYLIVERPHVDAGTFKNPSPFSHRYH